MTFLPMPTPSLPSAFHGWHIFCLTLFHTTHFSPPDEFFASPFCARCLFRPTPFPPNIFSAQRLFRPKPFPQRFSSWCLSPQCLVCPKKKLLYQVSCIRKLERKAKFFTQNLFCPAHFPPGTFSARCLLCLFCRSLSCCRLAGVFTHMVLHLYYNCVTFFCFVLISVSSLWLSNIVKLQTVTCVGNGKTD